jgi:two-component system OmpR family response regulator
MNSILLVEDDPALGRGLVVRLELEAYKVTWARSLHAAREENEKAKYDMIILDRGLPDGNGLDFCLELRKNGLRTPILMLTAQTDEDSVVDGLSAGANDYIRKPFGHKELLARIKTALGESTLRESQLKYGDLTLLLQQRKVMMGEIEVDLNRREFDVLSYFIERAEAVVTRDALLQSLDKGTEIFDRTFDSHVSHIRSKLKQSGVNSVQISSVYGLGYRLEKTPLDLKK